MRRNRKAFTLVELVIVISVIAILASVMIPTFSGMIKSAQKGADVADTASINTQLAIAKIDNETDLYAVIKEVYGDKADTFAPRSAKYGYHYWYDIANNKVVLASYEEIESGKVLEADVKADVAQNGALMATSDFALAAGTSGSAGAADRIFAPNNPRTVNLSGVGKFFLIDKTGSEIVEKLDEIVSISTGSEYQNFLSSFAGSFTDSLGTKIYENLLETAIVNVNGMFSNDDTPSKIYIPEGLIDNPYILGNKTFIGGYLKDRSEMHFDEVEFGVDLPLGVKVAAFCLNGLQDVELRVHAKIEASELGEIFGAYSTDCDIVLSDGEKYIINETKVVVKATGDELDITLDSITSIGGYAFDVVCTDSNASVNAGASEIYFDKTNDILYIAYDYTEPVALGLTKNLSNSFAFWSSSDSDVVSVNSAGVLTVNKKIGVGDNRSFKISAKLSIVADSADEITVELIRPSEVRFKVDGSEYSNTTTADELAIELKYYHDRNFTISGVNVNTPDIVKIEGATATDVTFTPVAPVSDPESDKFDPNCIELFTVEGNVIKLKDLGKGGYVGKYQYLTVKVGDHMSFDFKVTVADKSDSPFVLNTVQGKKLGEAFLFRVGNGNAFTLKDLFNVDATNAQLEADNTNISAVNVYNLTAGGGKQPLIGTTGSDETVTGTGIDVAVKGKVAEWDDISLDFVGTGSVKIEMIDAYGRSDELLLEVVDGKNATTYSELKSGGSKVVLLANVTMSDGDSYALTNGVLYGNGFTFDVTKGAIANINGDANYLIKLDNSTLDNVRVEGKVYTEYTDTASSGNYNRTLVFALGESYITNSYLANCASPVRVAKENAVVTIENTTLKGGSLANLDLRAGHVILDNVTTINQVEEGTPGGSVGAGIMIYYESVPATTHLTIRGKLTQYNNLAQTQVSTYCDGKSESLISNLFGSETVNVQYKDANGTVWINTGILSAMGSAFDADNITNCPYEMFGKSVLGKQAYFWSAKPTAETYNSKPEAWMPTAQGVVKPTVKIDHNKNKQDRVDGSNDYCIFNSTNGQVEISFSEGGSKVYDPHIFTATKIGNTLDYTVTIDGKVYNKGETITFTQTGTHTVTYTFTDPYNYVLGANGGVSETDEVYTVSFTISVTAVKAAAKDPVFTFYGYTSKTTSPAVTITEVKKVTDNQGNVWIMPSNTGTGVKTSDPKNGITINCPVVYVDFKDNSSDFNWLYPLFLGMKIDDYADGGTAANATTIVDKTSNSKPAGITIVSEAAVWSKGATVKSDSEGKLSTGTYKNLYGWTSSPKGKDADADTIYGHLTYKSEKGDTYNILVAFERAAHKKPSPSICVSPDTLVTLADGTQKRIDELTYDDQLMVWDFDEGKYTSAGILVIVNHGYDYNDVIELVFADGTRVKAINGHGFFNADTNEWVIIDASNVYNFFGSEFVLMDGNSYKTEKLVDAIVTNEYVEAWGLVTNEYRNCISNGVFSITPSLPFGSQQTIFSVNDDMMYDSEMKQQDIEKYGLYTYEEFSHLITYEEFEAFNVAEFKILVGKNYCTYQDVIDNVVGLKYYKSIQ